MNFTLLGFLAVVGMFVVMLLLLELGRRLGLRRLACDPEAAKSGGGAVEGAVFGLMGLLIAFTFSGAAARFDAHRSLVVEEANDISTAWLRLDLLPVNAQPLLREKFRQYVDARLAFYRALPDVAAARAGLARGAALQNDIWKGAVAACRDSGSGPATMLLPALNQMIDITTTRAEAARRHAPAVVFAMLSALVLAASLLVGYGMAFGRGRSWLYAFTFVLVITLAIYVILDFEFPRVGIIRLTAFDQVLMDVRQTMNP